MIVAPRFTNDGDDKMMLAQHDAYDKALGSILRISQRHFRCAAGLPDYYASDVRFFLTLKVFDHRVLQEAHDLIAAAWRFRRGRTAQQHLFEKTEPAEAARDWLIWLESEVESWMDAPELPRRVKTILLHQNDPIGHAAERSLCGALRERYSDIPWEPMRSDPE